MQEHALPLPMRPLTAPGEIFRQDFRSPDATQLATTPALRLLTWNIERGHHLQGIIEELRRINADVVALQEVDVGCDRSGGADTGVAIAQALGYNYIFFSEFEELRNPARSVRDQGGGVHGNAILTKYDILEAGVVRHRAHPVDWNDSTHALSQHEPRRGQRAVLRATLATPQAPLAVYCAHLEVFCGMLARIGQLADIFADARRLVDEGITHQCILGDLNTMAHGIARLSPRYCTDRMRYLSLGRDEAVMWQRHVLAVPDPRYDPTRDEDRQQAAQTQPGKKTPQQRLVTQECEDGSAATGTGSHPPPPPNSQLLAWGLSVDVASDALNPGFACPFPAATTVTLDNPAYKWLGVSLMRGKLDWALLRRAGVVGRCLGNEAYTLSDHKWMCVDVQLR